MEIIADKESMAVHAAAMRRAGKTIVFVPTMGYLHEGHISLVHAGKAHGDHHVVSIFVNPTQFGPNEDLAKYPRAMERDLAMCEQAGVNAVFAPRPDSMYGSGYQTYVELSNLPRFLCGKSRPGHFRGVATVVAKLFNIVLPHAAVFGEKDYQQLQVIRRMVADLDFPVKIVGVPTMREKDGLAMSSRNTYLSPEDRKTAAVLFESMTRAKAQVASGERDAAKVVADATALIASKPHTRVDYIALSDPDTLEQVDVITGPVVMALAVFVGATRLIDNTILAPAP